MTITARRIKLDTLNLRVDHKLKEAFLSAAHDENRPASEVLRGLMEVYVEQRERRQFEAEAKRQSALVASSPDEDAVMRWVENVSDTEGWV